MGSVKSCRIEDIDIAIEKLKGNEFNLGAFERSLILSKDLKLLEKEKTEFVDLITS